MKFSWNNLSLSLMGTLSLSLSLPLALAHEGGVINLKGQDGFMLPGLVSTLPEMEQAFLGASLEEELLERTTFISWLHQFDKVYESLEEMTDRFILWGKSVANVQMHNRRVDTTYQLAVNEYADWTDVEFDRYYGMDKLLGAGQKCAAQGSFVSQVDVSSLPTHVDWREKGVVSEVKNQGKCGSCWTFSTTGALEAHTAISTGKHVLLSEQQLVDCAQAFENNGCGGGLPSHAFEYVHYNGGLDTEEAYPYKGKDGGSCKFKSGDGDVEGFVKGVHNITQYSEPEIQEALATNGPVSIAFQVASDFRLYDGGVYSSTVCKSGPDDVNHAVLAVGYGVEDDGTPYWIVKNSWGPAWGMDGFFKILRGENMCGVATCASYPIV